MYRILYGNEVLHDPREPERILTDAKAELAVNEAGKLTFTVQPDHPLYGKLRPMNKEQEVVLEKDGTEIFRGRILSFKEGFYGGQEAVCEGELAYLNDVILRPYSSASGKVPTSVDGYFSWLVSEYNRGVDRKFAITVGINQGFDMDSGEHDVRENAEMPNVAQEMKDKLLQKLGGYVRMRRSGDMRCIDYLSSGDNAATQRIEFGTNLLDFTRNRDWSDYFNVIIPRGVSTDSGSGEQTGKIDISGEPDRELAGDLFKKGDRIIDNNSVGEYGHIERVVDFEGIQDPERLVMEAARYLRNVKVGDVLEMTAVDLNMLDPDIRPISIGDFVRATSKPHGYDEYFVCSKMTVNVSNPSENTFTLGSEYDYMTGRQSAKLSAMNASINSVYEETTKLTEEAKQAAQDARDAASSAVKDTYEEYAMTKSRTQKPGTLATWTKTAPTPKAGEFVWRRTVTIYGDGTKVTGDAVLMTGESVAAVELTSSNGTVIRNSRGFTTLRAAVLYGSERITDAATLEAYFGEGAVLTWMECGNGVFTDVPQDDARISERGFAFTVNASDISGDASYLCMLNSTM